MTTFRKVQNIIPAQATIEGAGVHLKRAFGYHQRGRFDPFLLLDDFHSDNPDDYRAGFPWHPHRGIETVTYIFHGSVEHGDNLGNRGVINGGDVQWMTAGSGIIHQEMPKIVNHSLAGFQLWVNLPAAHKMMNPRYREIKSAEIPQTELQDGVLARVIAGEINTVRGPVKDLVVNVQYLDIQMSADREVTLSLPAGDTAFAYIIEGPGRFGGITETQVVAENVALFSDGDRIRIRSEENPLRFLLVSGTPLKEPIAWGGPIVMNTEEQLQTAFREYHNGTFIKKQ